MCPANWTLSVYRDKRITTLKRHHSWMDIALVSSILNFCSDNFSSIGRRDFTHCLPLQRFFYPTLNFVNETLSDNKNYYGSVVRKHIKTEIWNVIPSA